MAAVMVELTCKSETVDPEPAEVALIGDVEALTAGTVPGCNDDNPYR